MLQRAGNNVDLGYYCYSGGVLRARGSRVGEIGDDLFSQGRVTSCPSRGSCTFRPVHITLGTEAALWVSFGRASYLRVSKVGPLGGALIETYSSSIICLLVLVLL